MIAEGMTLEAGAFYCKVVDDDYNADPRFLDALPAIPLRLHGSDANAGIVKIFFG